MISISLEKMRTKISWWEIAKDYFTSRGGGLRRLIPLSWWRIAKDYFPSRGGGLQKITSPLVVEDCE
jgi:hypothetical protein